jgi:hypothetical protein
MSNREKLAIEHFKKVNPHLTDEGIMNEQQSKTIAAFLAGWDARSKDVEELVAALEYISTRRWIPNICNQQGMEAQIKMAKEALAKYRGEK